MNRILRYSGKLSFTLLIALTIAMVVATFVEKANGSEYVHATFYGSAWFIACWITLALYAILYLIAQRVYKRMSNLCLHLALVLILAGAMVTHVSSRNGVIHLRQGTPNHFFQDESRGISAIPFTLELISFKINYYSGTSSPSDYVSTVKVNDPLNNTQFEAQISMNNILSYEGYRFYQSSFDDDMQGSVLSINRDVYGIPVTYAGYYFLFIAMLWVLLDKNGRFRQLLRSPMLKKSALLFTGVVLFAATSTASPTIVEKKRTVSHAQAEQLDKLWMLYDGRVVPLQTFARDFTVKLWGKPAYESYNAQQVLMGWLLFPEDWEHTPFFDINNADLQKLIGTKKASYADFFENGNNNYKLAQYNKEMRQGGKQSAFIKEAAKLDEKIQIIGMVTWGELLAVFPYQDNGYLQWFTPTPNDDNEMFIRHFFISYRAALLSQNDEQASLLLNKLITYQKEKGGAFLPSDTHRDVEILYNNLNIFSWLFKIALTLGLFTVILFILQTIKNTSYKGVNNAVFILLLCVFAAQTVGLGLRAYISGRLPLGNGFETMLFIAWCALLISLLLRRYSLLIPSFGFLISGFALLVAHLGSMNPKITHLVPVLSSSLLSIHVSVIMFSYALVGFITMNSLTTFVLLLFANRNNANTLQITINKLKVLSELFIYICAFLLAAGIFIGAIWANVSWGRYWGWDPKEVWALITFIIAALPFHRKTLTWFSNTFFFNVYMLLIFASVLMTYFGVNYFLGGMHSYAGNADMGKALLWVGITLLLLITLIAVAYKKYKTTFVS